MSQIRTLDVSLMALFTALTWLVTIVFAVYIPATRGFFNIGEVMVYTSGLLLTPYRGAFAAGVGSFAADLTLGYSYYAPATLVIKAGEAFIVGYLCRRKYISASVSRWRIFSLALSSTIAIAVASVGISFFTGTAEVTVGPSTGILGGLGVSGTYVIEIPWFFWVIVAVLVESIGIFFGLKVKPDAGWTIVAIFVGGLEMIFGYFVYQAYLILPLFNVTGIIALAEVPWNVTQMLIGLMVSIPLVHGLEKAYPHIHSP